MKKTYMIRSWNPWDCEDIYLKVFLTKKGAEKFVKEYELNKGTIMDEEIDIIEIERG